MARIKEKSSGFDMVGLETDYRMGILSLEQLALRYGLSKSSISKTVKSKGWVRDILADANRRAEIAANEEIARVKHLAPVAVEEVTGKMSDFIASIKFTQRADVRRARDIVMNLFDELDKSTSPIIREQFAELDETIAEGTPSEVNSKYLDIISLPKRVEMIGKLSLALKTLVELERKVYEMDIANQLKDDSVSTMILNIANNIGCGTSATVKPNPESAVTSLAFGSTKESSINIFASPMGQSTTPMGQSTTPMGQSTTPMGQYSDDDMDSTLEHEVN